MHLTSAKHRADFQPTIPLVDFLFPLESMADVDNFALNHRNPGEVTDSTNPAWYNGGVVVSNCERSRDMGKHAQRDPFGLLAGLHEATEAASQDQDGDGLGIQPSGGFGVIPQDRLCAIEGCSNRGTPHTCPHDGRRHRHGMIHYWGDYPKHSLPFREGWHLICDEHYKIVCEERQAFEDKLPPIVCGEIEVTE